jgi:ATP-dependent DNA helicase RecG
MVATTDGFELAEKDLEIRGGGQLLGARQSGLSDLRFARISKDIGLLQQARDVARELPSGTMAAEVEALLSGSEHLGAS